MSEICMLHSNTFHQAPAHSNNMSCEPSPLLAEIVTLAVDDRFSSLRPFPVLQFGSAVLLEANGFITAVHLNANSRCRTKS
jgi:hypothetical protein